MTIDLHDRQLHFKKTGNGPITIVLVHGGPGLTLDCLSIIHQMLDKNKFTVISYNQSGSAHNFNAPFYTTLEGYADELNKVIEALQLKHVFLLGHSFGTAIVQEFLFQYPKQPIKGIILCNGFSSGLQLKEAIKTRLSTMSPQFIASRQEILTNKDSATYNALLGEHWFPKYVCRLNPMPQDILTSLSVMAAEVVEHFIGPDLLNMTGALLDWDRTAALTKIKEPVLLMSGSYDYFSQDNYNDMFRQIPNAQAWYESEVSHFPMYEKSDSFSNGLNSFLSKYA